MTGPVCIHFWIYFRLYNIIEFMTVERFRNVSRAVPEGFRRVLHPFRRPRFCIPKSLPFWILILYHRYNLVPCKEMEGASPSCTVGPVLAVLREGQYGWRVDASLTSYSSVTHPVHLPRIQQSWGSEFQGLQQCAANRLLLQAVRENRLLRENRAWQRDTERTG